MNNLTDRIRGFLEYHQEVFGPIVFEPSTEMLQNPPLSMTIELDNGTSINLEELNTLEELREIAARCPGLQTDLAETRLVFGKGHPNADLMLVGEAPGQEEDRLGEPFVGRSGQLLTKILRAIGVERNHVYIANILKHRPPNNRKPHPEEAFRSLPFLIRQIQLIQPKLMLCLGTSAAHFLLNTNQPMKNLRGKWHGITDGVEVMVTYHPSALLRNQSWKRDTWEDVKKLRSRYDELGCEPAFGEIMP